jgi:transcriptional regulator with XRE-family HTH domain
MNTIISFEEFSALVGRRLRLFRHKNDEKLATAAKGLDISMAQLSDIENGSYQ